MGGGVLGIDIDSRGRGKGGGDGARDRWVHLFWEKVF